MPRIIEGKLDAKGLKFGIVVGRFNSFIAERLLEGAIDALLRHGADDGDIVVARVPGAFEIPLAAKAMADSGKYDALICLGAVIRGSTPHFDYVASEVSKGIAQVSMQTGCPIAFGVLTTDTIEQAVERAGTKAGNKGFDAAMTAIETANVMKGLKQVGARREGRELALQALYALDVNPVDIRTGLKLFWDGQKAPQAIREFTEQLVTGVVGNRSEIDALIKDKSKNWSLSRMSKVDLNILRIAAYELLYRQDIPRNVTINEGIEIAKKFGTEESPAFINGILDEIAAGVPE